MSDLDVLVKRTACPVCLHRVSVKQDGQLRSHGPRGSVCPGSNGTIGYRYRVTDSTLAEVPVGTHLIYAHYRGRTDQQDVVNFLEGTHDGGWFMEFMDMGVKFEGHWYLLDGTSEAAHNDTPSESTNPAAIGSPAPLSDPPVTDGQSEAAPTSFGPKTCTTPPPKEQL